MMNCLTNIMDIGNKTIVLICNPDDEKMFPFHHEEGSCMVEVANKPLIVHWLERFASMPLVIVAKQTPYILELANKYHAKVINYDDEMFINISNIDTDCILIDACSLVSTKDIINLCKQEENCILVDKWHNQDKAFAIGDTKDYIKEIYAHPRDHYASARVLDICKLSKEWIKELKFVKKGSFTINCGQMPDDKFHLASVIDQLIKKGLKCIPLYINGHFLYSKYAWDILEMNETYCKNMQIEQDEIDASAKIIDIKRGNGHIHVGKNSHLENITIESNCWIGDNVIIKDGAYLGNNCIIGDDTKINNHCLIHPNTVIGRKNKIGFGAEVSGVTMEGVAMVHTCEVYGVIGRYVDIAAGVIMAILRFDDQQVTRKVQGFNIRSNYTNAICIGDYVRTGVNNIFYPGVSVGSRSCLGPGMIIDKDVEANTLTLVKQEHIVKSWGYNKYGW